MAVIRVEKTRNYTVMSNHHLKDRELSLKAKGLLSMMLSLPDEWNYTVRGLAAICKEGVECISNTLSELERVGYMERNQLRDARGRLSDTEYVIFEKPRHPPDTGQPLPAPPHTDSPCTGNPDTVKPDMGQPDMENRPQLNTNESSTQRINTHGANTHQSIYPASGTEVASPSRNNGLMDRMESYRDLIMENIEYNILVERWGRERMDEIVELMLDTVCTQREYIRIGGDDYPREVVKSRLLKLGSSHVEYVFGCIDDNTTKVHNIRGYLLTSLYNAPTTMDSYYRAEVNHDLYGGGGR